MAWLVSMTQWGKRIGRGGWRALRHGTTAERERERERERDADVHGEVFRPKGIRAVRYGG
jgi:hypothetical protein